MNRGVNHVPGPICKPSTRDVQERTREQMAFCGICGRNHDPSTPCAVAGRPSGPTRNSTSKEGKALARRVDLILGIVAVLVLTLAVVYLALQ